MNDLFLMRIDAATGHIRNSTFLNLSLSPNPSEVSVQMGVDAAQNVFIAGNYLYPSSFTPTPGALQTSTPANSFVLRLNAALSAPVYATFWSLGTITALDVDASSNVIVGGNASGGFGSTPFTPVNPFPNVSQTPLFQGQAYIARLNSAGNTLSPACCTATVASPVSPTSR